MLYGAMNTVKNPETSEEVSGFLVKIPNPPKTAILRLPTTQQVLERLALQKYLRKDLGRGRFKNEFTPNPKADLELFSKMKVYASDDFDEYEAAVIIGRLTSRDIMSCEPDGGDKYKITLKHPFGTEDEPGLTVHVLKIPTLKQIAQYREAASDTINLPHDTREIRMRIEPACDLYDAVVISATGYDPSLGSTPQTQVPPHHKNDIILEVINASESLTESFGPNF